MVIHNGNEKSMQVSLPDSGKWNVYINGEKAGTEVIEQVTETITVEGISTVVLVKEKEGLSSVISGMNHKVIIIVAIVVLLLLIVGVAYWRHKRRIRRDQYIIR